MLKMADSAVIRHHIPTLPRLLAASGISLGGTVIVAAANKFSFCCRVMQLHSGIASNRLFVFPIRIFRMLLVPQRPAALHHRKFGEVVLGWRRSRMPLERPRVPRVGAGCRSPVMSPQQVDDPEQNAQYLENHSDG